MYFRKAACFRDGGYLTRCCAFLVELAAFASLYFRYPRRSLQRTLNELKEYQKQHDHYLHQQETLDKYKLLQEEQILRNIIHETQMAKEAQLGTAAFNQCIPGYHCVSLLQLQCKRTSILACIII